MSAAKQTRKCFALGYGNVQLSAYSHGWAPSGGSGLLISALCRSGRAPNDELSEVVIEMEAELAREFGEWLIEWAAEQEARIANQLLKSQHRNTNTMDGAEGVGA